MWKKLTKPMPLDSNFKDYDDYWKKRGFHSPSLTRAKLIAKHIHEDSSILDIGCGDGTMMEYLKKTCSPLEIVGIDISSQAVKHVKSKGLQAYKYDVLSQQFKTYLKGKKFDYILITEVLEHIQDPEELISLIKKHTNKSVFVSIPNSGFIIHRLRLLGGRFPLVSIQQHVKEHIRFWTLKDFIYWAGYHNYTVDKVIVASWKQNLVTKIARLAPGLLANQLIYKISNK